MNNNPNNKLSPASPGSITVITSKVTPPPRRPARLRAGLRAYLLTRVPAYALHALHELHALHAVYAVYAVPALTARAARDARDACDARNARDVYTYKRLPFGLTSSSAHLMQFTRCTQCTRRVYIQTPVVWTHVELCRRRWRTCHRCLP